MKYKFRLSYKDGNKYIPINLNSIDFLSDFNKTEIEAIDRFTTNFECYEEMINYLKSHSLIPNNIDRLYVTFDVKENDNVYQQLYAYNKTLFFKGDKERLKYSYIYRYFRDKIENGAFMGYIIEHYEKKYVHKNFTTLKTLVIAIKCDGMWSLESDDRSVYFEEFDKFLDFIFKKNTKKGTNINYKNIRDFLCFIGGEEPIKVKDDKRTKYQDVKKNNEFEFIEPDTVTLKEYNVFNRELSSNPDVFEPYCEGNDFIASASSKEIEDSLNAYAKKYSLKRDNGEYE